MTVLYYRKIGSGPSRWPKQITLLDENLKPTRRYKIVDSWHQAKQWLKKSHQAIKIQESTGMFKVYLPDGISFAMALSDVLSSLEDRSCP